MKNRKCDYCGEGSFHEYAMVYATRELEPDHPDYREDTLVGLTCDNCYEIQCLRELREDENLNDINGLQPDPASGVPL